MGFLFSANSVNAVFSVESEEKIDEVMKKTFGKELNKLHHEFTSNICDELSRIQGKCQDVNF